MSGHHPTEEMLLDHAAGALSRAESVIVATHMALCPTCRRLGLDLDAVGGALLDLAGAAPVRSRCEEILARVDADPPPTPVKAGRWDHETIHLIPQPLRGYLDGDVGGLAWRSINGALAEASLGLTDERRRASLMRIRAGGAMPRHTHGGTEMVLVLAGGFSDETGHYRRGDLALADGSMSHRPVADSDADCLCFAVVEGGLRLPGLVGRLLNLVYRG